MEHHAPDRGVLGEGCGALCTVAGKGAAGAAAAASARAVDAMLAALDAAGPQACPDPAADCRELPRPPLRVRAAGR